MSGRDISEEVAKRNNLPKAGVYVVSVEEFSAAEKAGIKAGDIVKAISSNIQGGGGGRPNLAQAGGKNPAGIDDALQAAKEWLNNK